MVKLRLNFDGLQLSAIIRGFIWSLVFTIVLGIIFSLLLQYTSLSERLLSSYSTFIFFISMFFGATIGSRAAGRKGLIHGVLITFIFWLITVVIGLIWNPDVFSIFFIVKRLGLTLLAGMLGGITGIGLSGK